MWGSKCGGASKRTFSETKKPICPKEPQKTDMALCPKIFTRAEDPLKTDPKAKAAQDKSEETKINTTLQLMSTQFLRISRVAVDLQHTNPTVFYVWLPGTRHSSCKS